MWSWLCISFVHSKFWRLFLFFRIKETVTRKTTILKLMAIKFPKPINSAVAETKNRSKNFAEKRGCGLNVPYWQELSRNFHRGRRLRVLLINILATRPLLVLLKAPVWDASRMAFELLVSLLTARGGRFPVLSWVLCCPSGASLWQDGDLCVSWEHLSVFLRGRLFGGWGGDCQEWRLRRERTASVRA